MYLLVSAQSVNSDSAWVSTLTAKAQWPNSMVANLILLTASFHKDSLCEDAVVFQQHAYKKGQRTQENLF